MFYEQQFFWLRVLHDIILSGLESETVCLKKKSKHKFLVLRYMSFINVPGGTLTGPLEVTCTFVDLVYVHDKVNSRGYAYKAP